MPARLAFAKLAAAARVLASRPSLSEDGGFRTLDANGCGCAVHELLVELGYTHAQILATIDPVAADLPARESVTAEAMFDRLHEVYDVGDDLRVSLYDVNDNAPADDDPADHPHAVYGPTAQARAVAYLTAEAAAQLRGEAGARG